MSFEPRANSQKPKAKSLNARIYGAAHRKEFETSHLALCLSRELDGEVLIQGYIFSFQRLEVATLARSIEMIQKGRYQRFAIVLSLLVEARGKGHQIAIVGGSVAFAYLLYFDIESRQPDDSSEAELEKHLHSARFQPSCRLCLWTVFLEHMKPIGFS